MIKNLSLSMDEVTNWFSQYQLDSIELIVNGVIEADSMLKLIVSAKEERGLKVTLNPNLLDDKSLH